jgi:hypothetical protein
VSEPTIAGLVAAVLLAGLFGATGFNRPSWSRSHTTAAFYWMALGLHVCVYVLILLSCFAVLAFASRYADRAGVPAGPATLVWVALALTFVVRAVPALSRRPRAWLHGVAGIPAKAQRFAKVLAESELACRPDIREEARAILESRGIDADRDWLPLARPAHRQLEKATELFLQLRKWEEDPRFASFLVEARNDFNRLRQRFDRLSIRVARTFGAIERLADLKEVVSRRSTATASQDSDVDGTEGEVDEILRRLVPDMIADSCEDISGFYRDACLMTARGVLVTERLRSGRDAAIERLGFRPGRVDHARTLRPLAYTAALLFAGILLYFLLRPGKTDQPALLALLITTNLMGAVLCAVWPKTRWAFANSGLREKAPVGFVLLAGAAAVVLAVVVNAAFAFDGSLDSVKSQLDRARYYLHSSFMTAAAVAWLVQDHRWSRLEPALRRRFDALALGGVWMFSTLLSIVLRHQGTEQPADALWVTLASEGWWRLPVWFVLGAAVGYGLPGSFRVATPRRALVRKPYNAPGAARTPLAAAVHPHAAVDDAARGAHA